MIKVLVDSGFQTTAFSLCLHGAERARALVSLPVLIRTTVFSD